MIVQLDNLAFGGEAVGRLDGKAVFVAGGIPGERVRVEMLHDAGRYARARLIEVLDPSPDRVVPPCPYYDDCGGCHLQHISYPRQLELKRQIVQDQLVRLGGINEPQVLPTLGMSTPWAYRNQVQLHAHQGAVGYQRPQSHVVVPVSHCAIAHPLIDACWPATVPETVTRLTLRAGVGTGERLALVKAAEALATTDLSLPDDVAIVQPMGTQLRVLRHLPWLHERLLGFTMRVSAQAFFQNNTAQAEALVSLAGEALALQPGERLLDAYCGVGAFMLPLLPAGGRGLGIESSPEAVADARVNARLANIERQVRFVEGDVGRVLARRQQCDAVVLDPPRAGCSPKALAFLAATGASRIAYVSCDPATLARDIGRLGAEGYRLEWAQPVDMFPQTYHVECVALLSRV